MNMALGGTVNCPDREGLASGRARWLQAQSVDQTLTAGARQIIEYGADVEVKLHAHVGDNARIIDYDAVIVADLQGAQGTEYDSSGTVTRHAANKSARAVMSLTGVKIGESFEEFARSMPASDLALVSKDGLPWPAMSVIDNQLDWILSVAQTVSEDVLKGGDRYWDDDAKCLQARFNPASSLNLAAGQTGTVAVAVNSKLGGPTVAIKLYPSASVGYRVRPAATDTGGGSAQVKVTAPNPTRPGQLSITGVSKQGRVYGALPLADQSKFYDVAITGKWYGAPALTGSFSISCESALVPGVPRRFECLNATGAVQYTPPAPPAGCSLTVGPQTVPGAASERGDQGFQPSSSSPVKFEITFQTTQPVSDNYTCPPQPQFPFPPPPFYPGFDGVATIPFLGTSASLNLSSTQLGTVSVNFVWTPSSTCKIICSSGAPPGRGR